MEKSQRELQGHVFPVNQFEAKGAPAVDPYVRMGYKPRPNKFALWKRLGHIVNNFIGR